jgi:hypothetical protein
MNMTRILIALLLLISLQKLSAQENGVYNPMQKLFEVDNFEVQFMFYSSGNGVSDNGINLLIHNKNDYDISYSFDLIFKSKNNEKIQTVNGTLKAKERQTGSNAELFFLPFEDGSAITHLGATKVRVKKSLIN